MTYYQHYFVNDNAQANGDHEVHVGTCSWLTLAKSKTYLGYYANCKDAVSKARTIYTNVDGCAYCCSECHRT